MQTVTVSSTTHQRRGVTTRRATHPAVKKTIKIRCHHCRKPFSARRSDALYCSKECRQKASRARLAKDKKRAAGQGGALRTCSCGQSFAARGNKQYCSPACRQAAYRKRKDEAVTLLSIVGQANGVPSKTTRKHTRSWPLGKIQTALRNAGALSA